MSWNFDYDICAAILISTLIIYYEYRKCLPLTYNRLFLGLMVSSVCVAITDIISSVMTTHEQSFTPSIIYFVNIIYYVLLAVTPAIFGCYTASVANRPIKQRRDVWNYIILIPVIIVLIVVVTTPINHLVFSVTEESGFTYGRGRILLYYETLFYLILSVVTLYVNRKRIRRVKQYSIYIYAFFSFVGHTMQVFYDPYTQTVSLGATIGLLIVFLAFENPDYDRDRKTGMYREAGIRKIKEEDSMYGITRPAAGVGFDNFEHIKSVYGEMTANKLIQDVSKFLQISFPEIHKFYVHNGRFIALYDGEISTLREFRDQILERCKKPFTFEGGDVYLSPIFVFTIGDIPMENFEVFRSSMRVAFDRGKEQGKGCVVRLTGEMYQEALRSLKIEEALKKALTGDNLLVYYQPIYDTKEGRVTSAEALVRIYDEELGVLYPDDFIWRAEENGSILALGEQVFRKACKFIRNHDMKEMGLNYIEINLSPLQCIRKQLALEFEKIIEEYQIDGKYINLEITETATGDINVIRENMRQLRERGIGFSLDDYGTGYSNLVNVMSLPLDIVKIDKSLVWAYFKEGNDLLCRVIHTFTGSSLKMVVEGVETEEMAGKLADMGCHYEQGYYYSKPIPEKEFLEFIYDRK
ncbi:MAG: GGDEF domain-containing phosphodiesterase [Lachnospiraceae bacterium]|nr:GGDEF domain-containing phosphodiesterase [Lachnospiraceae bacterium]